MPQPLSAKQPNPPKPQPDAEELTPLEAPQAIVTELSPRRKPAGKPEVRANTARPKSIGSGTRVVVPGLGKVTLVIH
jgi:hypothetical protein